MDKTKIKKASFQIKCLTFILIPIFCSFASGESLDSFGLLHSEVDELPSKTRNQSIKKAVLELALENAGKLAKEGDMSAAKELVEDVKNAIEGDTGSLKNVPANILPRIPEWDRNPYIEVELNYFKTALKNPDKVVYLGQRGARQFNKKSKIESVSHNPRLFAAEIRDYAWAGLHPQSPYCGDPEILKRAFRRAHAYVDAYNRTSLTLEEMNLSINDFFACYSFLDGLLTLKSGVWEFVLPSQRKQWLLAAKKARDSWLSYIDTQGGWWDGESINGFGSFCNHHITKGMIIQFAGMILEDSEHADVARRVIALQKNSLLPDGGIRYISKQNEIYGYHMVNIEKLVRQWELTGDQSVLELLKATRNYYPLSTEPGNVAEYWTAPYWKYQWHGGAFGHGAEVVAGLLNCGYNRAIAQQNLDYGVSVDANHGSANIIAAPYYRSQLKPKKRLDNFVVYDRNVMSPRGRFGRFSFVGTTRDYGEHPGKMSFMGCMVTDPPTRTFPLNAALKAVYPKVLLNNDMPNWQGSAYLSYQEKNATCVGHRFGSLSTSYNMLTTTYGHAVKPVNWSADQQWLCLPDRIIGVVSVYPSSSKEKAYGVSGHIRLGYGLSKANKKEMKQLTDEIYAYGDLRVKLHTHNYAEVSTEISGILRDDRRYATEIILSDEKGGKTNTNTLNFYSNETPYYFTTEVYPFWSKPASSVEIFRKDQLSGLEVVLENKSFLLVHNRGNIKEEYLPKLEKWNTKRKSVLYTSSAGVQINPIDVVIDNELSMSIPAFSHQLLISSSDSDDFKSGIYNFDELLK